MTRIFSLALIAAVFTICIPASAQSNTEAMQRLAAFNGTYTLDGTARVDEGTFGGSLTVSPILNGNFQQWDWEMTMRGEGVDEKVYLRFIAKYDATADEYTIYRFDSRNAGSPTRSSNISDPSRGTLRFDGDALVMMWPMSNPNDPSKTGNFRNTVHLDRSGLRVETDVKPDDGSPLIAVATTRAARK